MGIFSYMLWQGAFRYGRERQRDHRTKPHCKREPDPLPRVLLRHGDGAVLPQQQVLRPADRTVFECGRHGCAG